MSRYQVKRRVINLKDHFDVVETLTCKVIETYENKQMAHELARLLQSGSGFDGFTPGFFVENTNRQANAEVKEIRSQKDVD